MLWSRCKLTQRLEVGQARVIAAHTKHGRWSKVHVARVKAINAELRRITYGLKRGRWIP